MSTTPREPVDEHRTRTNRRQQHADAIEQSDVVEAVLARDTNAIAPLTPREAAALSRRAPQPDAERPVSGYADA